MRYLLTIQYRGTRYAGWQTQTNATGVQQVLASSFERLCGRSVVVEGAGRTDSGVHALAQRAHVDVPIDIDERGLVLGINTTLPDDIRVLEARPVADDFHARFQATGKIYEYRIWNASVNDVFRGETHAHIPRALDVDVMQAAAEPLAGHHDFRAFTVADPEVSSTWRTIRAISVASEQIARPQAGTVVRIRVVADGFLRYMARRIVGSLIEAGAGRLRPDEVGSSLEPRFAPARWTAPAHGLTLVEVLYD